MTLLSFWADIYFKLQQVFTLFWYVFKTGTSLSRFSHVASYSITRYRSVLCGCEDTSVVVPDRDSENVAKTVRIYGSLVIIILPPSPPPLLPHKSFFDYIPQIRRARLNTIRSLGHCKWRRATPSRGREDRSTGLGSTKTDSEKVYPRVSSLSFWSLSSRI